MGSEAFWEPPVRLGYVPAPRPTLKKALCHIQPDGRIEDKYRWRENSWIHVFSIYIINTVKCKQLC